MAYIAYRHTRFSREVSIRVEVSADRLDGFDSTVRTGEAGVRWHRHTFVRSRWISYMSKFFPGAPGRSAYASFVSGEWIVDRGPCDEVS